METLTLEIRRDSSADWEVLKTDHYTLKMFKKFKTEAKKLIKSGAYEVHVEWYGRDEPNVSIFYSLNGDVFEM